MYFLMGKYHFLEHLPRIQALIQREFISDSFNGSPVRSVHSQNHQTKTPNGKQYAETHTGVLCCQNLRFYQVRHQGWTVCIINFEYCAVIHNILKLIDLQITKKHLLLTVSSFETSAQYRPILKFIYKKNKETGTELV